MQDFLVGKESKRLPIKLLGGSLVLTLLLLSYFYIKPQKGDQDKCLVSKEETREWHQCHAHEPHRDKKLFFAAAFKQGRETAADLTRLLQTLSHIETVYLILVQVSSPKHSSQCPNMVGKVMEDSGVPYAHLSVSAKECSTGPCEVEESEVVSQIVAASWINSKGIDVQNVGSVLYLGRISNVYTLEFLEKLGKASEEKNDPIVFPVCFTNGDNLSVFAPVVDFSETGVIGFAGEPLKESLELSAMAMPLALLNSEEIYNLRDFPVQQFEALLPESVGDIFVFHTTTERDPASTMKNTVQRHFYTNIGSLFRSLLYLGVVTSSQNGKEFESCIHQECGKVRNARRN